jgi:ABC-type nitrate/sulfonate/bicarbonate transport system permease component
LGALAFWGPEIFLYAWERRELNRALITFLLPASLLLVYLWISLVRYRNRDTLPRPSAAVFMLLGVLSLGTLAIAIGSTMLGGGFHEHPGTTLLAVLLGTLMPLYAFIAATYDGSLYALILAVALMPLIHLVFERHHWIIPPRVVTNSDGF